jgi:membrane protein required for colicin V production
LAAGAAGESLLMNWTDYAIIAVLAASCIVGVVRGLLREVISVITWVAAVLLSWQFASVLAPHLGGALRDEAVRPWAARAIIFVGVLLLGAAIGALVAHFVRLSLFSGVDRMLGFVFGLLRGAVVLGLLAILSHALRLHEEPWYRESTLVPYAEQSGNVLRGLVGERKIRAAGLQV